MEAGKRLCEAAAATLSQALTRTRICACVCSVHQIHPSGSIAVCGGEDKAVHVLDFEKGGPVREWRGHERAVNRLARFRTSGLIAR